jgi:hypothetical protein
MRSTGAVCPVNSSNCCAACPTNISSPLTVLQPSASASCIPTMSNEKEQHIIEFGGFRDGEFSAKAGCSPCRHVTARLDALGRKCCSFYLDELCSKWRVNCVEYKLAVLESLSADWTLPLCVVHANGSAVHENISSDLPTADSFQGNSFCIGAAQRSCQVICFLPCPAMEGVSGQKL